jgi:tetratricopeptide (TPR) repeat protein
MASARRHERVAYPLEPTLPALLQELEQGRAVLVLQNFGLGSFPLWHYAVVIGYDRSHDTFLLRSGRHRRLELAAARFLGTWRRSGNWAFIVLRPGELPADASAKRYLDAVAALEALGHRDAALESYQAAIGQWPAEPLAWFALANTQLALGHAPDAEAAYREVLRLAPDHVPARNNLALQLARRGCRAEALAMLAPTRAAAAGGALAAEVEDSWREINAQDSEAGACTPP